MIEVIEKAEEWVISECWLTFFDILGFRNLMSVDEDNLKAFQVRVDYEETIENLKKTCADYRPGYLDYCWFSDTFLMFTPDDSAQSYCVIEFAAKDFITRCIDSRIPIRGAISVGSFMRSKDNRSFIGSAFLDAYEYGEDQDWLGLIITPKAIKKAESYELYPTHHDFVRSETIPMRKYKSSEVLAFRFQSGKANYPCPLLQILNEMKIHSEEKYRAKYEKTIQFIKDHHRWLK